MTKRIGFAAALILTVTLSAMTPEDAPTITVHVYNYAGLEQETLDRAEREAARIYEHTGLRTEWVDCATSPEDAAKYPACDQPLSANRLVLRVIDGDMARRMKLPKQSFGRSLLTEDGSFGQVAIVCAHRAGELAKKIRYSEGAILGHLIAHELGHLLLGVGSHAPTGIMHVPWYPEELETIRQGTMYFNSKQAKQIHARTIERVVAAGGGSTQRARRAQRLEEQTEPERGMVN